MSDAISDHIVHVVVTLRIVTEKHINSGHDSGEGECATVILSVSQPISDIGNLLTQAMSIDEICFSVSQLSNGDRSAGDSVQKRNHHIIMT